MDVVVLAIIVLAILGTGILWVMNAKSGSFGWKIKTALFEVGSQAKGEKRADIEQIQEGGQGNKQTASKDAKSRQTQKDGVKNTQEIK